MTQIEKLINELSPNEKKMVEEFANRLLERHKKPGKKLRQDWAGALREFRGKYTSIELQKKALEWRGD